MSATSGYWRKLLGTFERFFRVGGPDAPGIASSSGVLQARNSDNNGLTRFQASPGTTSSDVIVKSQMDAISSKTPCRAATTGALPACTAAGSGVGKTLTANVAASINPIDGVTLAVGDRLLVKDQAAPANNGIYTVTVVGTGLVPWVLTRATDADSSAEFPTGMTVYVSEGTQNLDHIFQLVTNAPITLEATGLVFSLGGGVTIPTNDEKAGLSANSPSAANPVQTLTQIQLRSRKAPVRLATIIALPACTAAGAGVTKTLTGNAPGQLADQDGVTPAAGNRLLVKDQAAPEDNGIYTVTVLGDGATAFVLTRAVDANSSAKMASGVEVAVEEGTVNGDRSFMLVTNNPIVLDTTGLTFSLAGGISIPTPDEKAGLAANTPTAANPVQTLAQIRRLTFKSPVRLATAAALPACTPAGAGVGKTLTENPIAAALQVDGVAVVLGDRILVKDQVAPEDNGIYTVTDPGGGAVAWVLTRAADADQNAEVLAGMLCHVEEGTANANTFYQLTSNNPIVVDTNPLVFGVAAFLPAGHSQVQRYYQVINFGDVTDPTPNHNVVLAGPPTNCIFLGGCVELDAPFIDGAACTCTAEIGDAADPNEMADQVAVGTGEALGIKNGIPTTQAWQGVQVAYAPLVRFSASVNLNTLTAGSLVAHLYYIQLAAVTP